MQNILIHTFYILIKKSHLFSKQYPKSLYSYSLAVINEERKVPLGIPN